MRFLTWLTIPAVVCCLAGAMLAAPAAASRPAGKAPVIEQDALEKAIASAIVHLRQQIGDDGKCAGEYLTDSPRFGAKTGLCVCALLSAEVDYKDAAVRRAVDWLLKQNLTGTYAVAMRACALATYYQASHEARLADQLKADLQWLLAAADKDGAYADRASSDKGRSGYDNFDGQAAIMGVWAAANAVGVEVPDEYWRKVQKHWLAEQQTDGGWGYLTPKGELRARTYGSMTAAGLASMYICYDNLNREQFVKCAEGEGHKPIDIAAKWLGERFSAGENPSRGVEHYYDWLLSLARVSQASGQRYLGGHDWYAEGAAELLDRQTPRGSWGYGDGVEETASALMFLAQGRRAVLINKLGYDGKWNARPRDVANFSTWMSRTFEQNVGWQVVRLDAQTSDIQDAPILYISGAGPCELTDQQIDKIRQFVYRGGVIVSEAAGSNGDFTLDMQKIYGRLFPELRLERIGRDHPIHSMNFRTAMETDPALSGVSNGARLLAIHCPNELSLGLQMGYRANYRQSFELLSNISLYVTDKGNLPGRGTATWPVAQSFQPKQTISVARIKYNGNYDPEPLAWQRLVILMGNRQQIKLDVSAPMEIAKLDAARWPVAAMTGTSDFTLSDEELAALKKYITTGGTLILDAAGGGKAFTDAVERQIVPLLPNSQNGLVASGHPVLQGPAAVKIAYRRELSISLGSARNTSRLRGVQVGDRLAILYSPEDITAGLVGYHVAGINGYTPDTAVTLMINMLVYGAKGKSADKPVVHE